MIVHLSVMQRFLSVDLWLWNDQAEQWWNKVCLYSFIEIFPPPHRKWVKLAKISPGWSWWAWSPFLSAQTEDQLSTIGLKLKYVGWNHLVSKPSGSKHNCQVSLSLWGDVPENLSAKRGWGEELWAMKVSWKEVCMKNLAKAPKRGVEQEGVLAHGGTLKPKLATGKEDNVPPNCLFLTIQVDEAKILDKP